MSKTERDLNNNVGILINIDLPNTDDTQDGTADPDIINGNGGNDTINGLGGDDTLNGGDGDDTLNGGEGDDTLNGNDGTDTINGDEGDDTIDGGDGDDTIDGGSGADTIDGGDGADTIEGGTGDDIIDGEGGSDTLNGGDGIDDIQGGTGDDIIDGGAGDDIIDGGDDADTISGGEGDDTIDGGAGDDNILGGAGADTIDGGTGADTIDGEAGEDVIRGGIGADVLSGGADADTIEGGDDDDTITGGEGDDTLLSGDDGADTIDGEAGDDTIDGGAGDDILNGGAGNDNISGGANDDTIDGGEGDDELSGGTGDDVLISEAGNDTLDGEGGDDRFQVGLTGAQELQVGDSGGGSDDLLLHFQGLGSVSIHFDEEDNLIAEAAISDGQTPILLGFGLDGYSSFDDLDGDDAVIFRSGQTGTAGNDFLLGTKLGIDRFDAGDGNDHIWSWEGDDVIAGGDGDDVYQFRSGDGQDTIIESGGTDTVFLPEFTLGSTQFTRVRDDLLIRYGSDIIEIDDYYDGAGGPELLVFKRANEEALTRDYVIDIFSAVDELEPVGFDADPRSIPGLSFNAGGSDNAFRELTDVEDRAFGNEGNDTFLGLGDDDRLAGAGGRDRLIGGMGDDFILGEAGDDFLHDLDVLDNVTEELSRREFEDGRDHDEMEGGAGNDELWTSFGINFVKGQSGDDVYYSAIRGTDTIDEGGSTSTVSITDSKEGNLSSGSRIGDSSRTRGDQDTLDLLWREPALIKIEGRILDEDLERTTDMLITDTLFPGEFQVQIVNQMNAGTNGFEADRIEFVQLTARDGDKQKYYFVRDLDSPTVSDDMIVGSNLNDRDILGGKGDDIFFLAGGRDIMRGGEGDDIFVIASGDDFDRITDTEGEDTIILPDETDIADVDIFRIGDDLVIVHGGGEDVVELIDYFAENAKNQVEWLQLGVDSDILDPDPEAGDTQTIDEALAANRLDLAELADAAAVVAEFRDDDDLNRTGTRVDETLGGDLGDNELSGEQGNDVLIGFTGDDTLDGGKGSDELEGGRGNDVLRGGAGDDRLFGYGRETDEQALYIEDDDVLQGGKGNDLIEGAVGDDDIRGGSGDDTIYGWFMDLEDTALLIETQQMWEYKTDEDGKIDTSSAEWFRPVLVEGEGEEADTLGDVLEANLLIYNTSDAAANPSGFYTEETVDLNFDDDDYIDAGDGDDLIFLGLGSDTAIGGSGADVYDFTIIGENDELGFTSLFTDQAMVTIDDRGDSENEDTVILDSFIAESMEASRDGDDVVLTSERLIIRLVGQGVEDGDSVIETFRDETGANITEDLLSGLDVEEEEEEVATNLIGTEGEDTLQGTDASNELLLGKGGNDVLNSGAGFDEMRGGDGDDVYIIAEGDGADVIVDSGGTDELQFAEDARPDFIRLANDLLIQYSSTLIDRNDDEVADDEDILLLEGYFLPGGKDIEFFRIGANGSRQSITDETSELDAVEEDPRQVEHDRATYGTEADDVLNGTEGDDDIRTIDGNDRVRADDGDDVIDGGKGLDNLRGDKGDDTISGGNGKDRLRGGTGEDELDGGKGNDRIEGGRGDDVQTGGAGNDRFQFGADAGDDEINESGGGTDFVSLTEESDGLNPFGMFRDGDDLVITHDEDDSVTVTGQFGGDTDMHVERFRLPDGTVYQFVDGVDGDREKQVMLGTDGDDIIDAGKNTDIVVGGEGDDRLTGNDGDDIYLFRTGDGDDTIAEKGKDTDIDTIILSDLMTAATIEMEIDGDNLIIAYGDDGDSITIRNQFAEGNAARVENLMINDNDADIIDLTGDLSDFL